MASSSSRNLEVLGLGWSLGWRIAAGVLLGFWLDGRAGTAPWLTLLLSLAALAAGVIQILRLTSQKPGASDADQAP